MAFVSFLQNHDQAGNRPFGERIHCLIDPERLRTVITLLLLAPAPPLLFMGEEFAAARPFQFFCDFSPELMAAVAAGRRRGFACFEGFARLLEHRAPPDPNDPDTFDRCKLDWDCLDATPHVDWLGFYRNLLELRHNQIVPRLAGMQGNAGTFRQIREHGLWVRWRLGDGSGLTLVANLGDSPLPVTATDLAVGKPLYACPPSLTIDAATDQLPPWCVVWFLQDVRA